MQKTDRTRGFVLLMTLLLLALAAVTLADFCRRSATLAVDAVHDQDELQRYWGAQSMQTAVLDRAGFLFSLADARGDMGEEPTLMLRHAVTLGNVRFEAVLQDEQAKLNLNTILQTDGIDGLFRRVRSFLSANNTPLRVKAPIQQRDQIRQTIDTWAQVFEQPLAHELFPYDNESGCITIAAPLMAMTCWGDGRVNFRRAPRERIIERCSGVLTNEQIDQLLGTRTDDLKPESIAPQADQKNAEPTAGLQHDAWIDLSWDDATQRAAKACLTDRSSCYALAMAIRHGTRSDYHLWVRIEPSGDHSESNGQAFSTPIIYRFAWQ